MTAMLAQSLPSLVSSFLHTVPEILARAPPCYPLCRSFHSEEPSLEYKRWKCDVVVWVLQLHQQATQHPPLVMHHKCSHELHKTGNIVCPKTLSVFCYLLTTGVTRHKPSKKLSDKLAMNKSCIYLICF